MSHLREEGDHSYRHIRYVLVTKAGKGRHRTGKGCLQKQVQLATGTDSLTSFIEYMCYIVFIVHLLHYKAQYYTLSCIIVIMLDNVCKFAVKNLSKCHRTLSCNHSSHSILFYKCNTWSI